jgi:hypothetical protein
MADETPVPPIIGHIANKQTELLAELRERQAIIRD